MFGITARLEAENHIAVLLHFVIFARIGISLFTKPNELE